MFFEVLQAKVERARSSVDVLQSNLDTYQNTLRPKKVSPPQLERRHVHPLPFPVAAAVNRSGEDVSTVASNPHSRQRRGTGFLQRVRPRTIGPDPQQQLFEGLQEIGRAHV